MRRGNWSVPPGYEWIQILGTGGHGVVSLARHQALDRVVAVKRVASTPGRADEAVARFRREARALARLDHPAIVRIYDVVATEGDLFIVMEYVDGHDFRMELASTEPDLAARVRVLHDIAAALAHAGARGVVHRDVKPGNVFLVRDGGGKLGDFGIARLLSDAAPSLTATGTTVGTPTYMAPEQILGNREIGPSADVYAFAALAYEATVGRPPFEANSVRGLLDAHLLQPPAHPGSLLTGYPAVAADALLAGLDKEPAARPTVMAIADVLASVPSARWPSPLPPSTTVADVQSRHTATIVRDAATPGAVPVIPEVASPSARASAEPVSWLEPAVFCPDSAPRSARWRWIAGAIAVAVLVIGGAYAFFGPNSTSSADSLEVRGVTVTIPSSARSGDCAHPDFTFVGRVVTNGQPGPLRVRWRAPDGTLRPPVEVTVKSGSTEVHPRLHFLVSGSGELEGKARLEVLAPGRGAAMGPRVFYSCP